MSHPTLSRALIPCGGAGTRMRALTGGAPKELLPVGGVSAVERVARECAAAGVRDVLVVIAPGKESVWERLAALADAPGMPARMEVAVQHAPRGLADAMRLGREFAAGDPLVVALPDNLFLGDEPAVAQVASTWARHRASVVAVVEIAARDAARRGPTAVYEGWREGDDFRLRRIPDKGARGGHFDTGGSPSAFTGVGRYVLEADAFAAIDAVERELPAGAELDDVPVLQRLLARGRLVGSMVRGRFLDLGLPAGHAEADALLGGA